MEVYITIESSISLMTQDAEYESAIPGDEFFELDEEFMDFYSAEYSENGDIAELSYNESEEDGVFRVLIYDKSTGILTIRRERGAESVDIRVGEGVIHKNDYYIEGVGTVPMETYGKSISWGEELAFEYYTYLGEVWSKIVMRIVFLDEIAVDDLRERCARRG